MTGYDCNKIATGYVLARLIHAWLLTRENPGPELRDLAQSNRRRLPDTRRGQGPDLLSLPPRSARGAAGRPEPAQGILR